jgi:hypothetical protein
VPARATRRSFHCSGPGAAADEGASGPPGAVTIEDILPASEWTYPVELIGGTERLLTSQRLRSRRVVTG